ncbi:MAG: SRPBCC family protein [Thiobacillaceae bacterium]|nr:SRPBCC family protein [Thiobacillaceae bacterium]MDW8323294.1 SRPBCC family protein [Burkholderiales bacterium]
MRAVAALVLALGLAGGALAAEDPAEPVAVAVVKENGHYQLSAEFRVPVSLRTAWAVLTDFEHMAEFLPGVKESHVIAHSGNQLTVQQKGESPTGLIPVEYETLRLIELRPYQSIRSRTLKGNLGSVEGETRLTAEGRNLTLVQYTATAHPDSALAGLVPSSLLKDGLKAQFQAMRAEMLRRARLQVGKSLVPPGGG